MSSMSTAEHHASRLEIIPLDLSGTAAVGRMASVPRVPGAAGRAVEATGRN